MIIISYDITDDKKRTRFNKYIRRFGHRLQYTVYEIDNSERILNNIVNDINNKFLKEFDESDSVYIFQLSSSCKMLRVGYAVHEDEEVFFIEV